MKPINTFLATGLLAGLSLAAVPMSASAEPQVTMQQERVAHPELVDAIHRLRGTVRSMETSPEDYGGYKAVAIADARRAIHSLKKALYWRLKMDDAALDRAE